MDFSALLDGLQWALDAGCNQLENPCLPSVQLDVEASVDPVPTRMEDVQVAPEYDLMDLDLVVASFASTSESSFYPQPTAASGMVGLEDSVGCGNAVRTVPTGHPFRWPGREAVNPCTRSRNDLRCLESQNQVFPFQVL